MYIALTGTAAQGSGPGALAVSLTTNGADFLDLSGIGGEGFPVSSGAGEIDLTATASGGDGNYSYAWSITESGDTNNINTGNIQVSDPGTSNQAQYDDAIVTGFDTGLTSVDPPVEATLFFSCTVTDGTGATATPAFPSRIVAVVRVLA